MHPFVRRHAGMQGTRPPALEDGSRVAVIGGGPSGSLFAFFLLGFAQLLELDLRVDVYEPRDFAAIGPGGCNMCAGIVSESLVQMLALEGVDLPDSVVQRGIDAYVVTTNAGQARVATPTREQRVAAVHRGGGPRDATDRRWGGLDGHLLSLARSRGANVVRRRVREVAWEDGRPSIVVDGAAETYDLLVGATGVNSGAWQLYESLGLRSTRPRTAHAYLTEVCAETAAIGRGLGSAMYLYLLDIPRLDFAAIVPKGDFFTVCLLGRDIDREVVDAFFESAAVRCCFPDGLAARPGACHCGPKINVREASVPYMDRLVLVGDCGVTRLYKDGLGAAYRTAKAAARTAAFVGVSATDFRAHYLPVYRAIARDNRYGATLFALLHRTRRLRWLHGAALAAAAREVDDSSRRTSGLLWDVFTGSAPYRNIAARAADPRVGAVVARETLRALARSAMRPIGVGHELPGPR